MIGSVILSDVVSARFSWVLAPWLALFWFFPCYFSILAQWERNWSLYWGSAWFCLVYVVTALEHLSAKWCREVSANGEDKPLRAKSEDEENAHVQCFDYIFDYNDYIRFALSNFRVSFHVCSCLFMSARGAPKSLHIPLGPGRSATLAAACSWKGLHWTVQRIPSYSGHLEGASPTSSNHDEPLPGKSLQAFVCSIILMTFRF